MKQPGRGWAFLHSWDGILLHPCVIVVLCVIGLHKQTFTFGTSTDFWILSHFLHHPSSYISKFLLLTSLWVTWCVLKKRTISESWTITKMCWPCSPFLLTPVREPTESTQTPHRKVPDCIWTQHLFIVRWPSQLLQFESFKVNRLKVWSYGSLQVRVFEDLRHLFSSTVSEPKLTEILKLILNFF